MIFIFLVYPEKYPHDIHIFLKISHPIPSTLTIYNPMIFPQSQPQTPGQKEASKIYGDVQAPTPIPFSVSWHVLFVEK